MAALGAQSIASSYEQLLHVDADGGGTTTTHVSVKDGDNGTTFGFTIASDALMMSSTNRLEFGDTGTYIFQSADGVLDLVSDTEIEINATTIDMNGALDLSGNAQLSGTVTVGADGSGTDVIFYSGTAGDNLTWDASDEKLIITGTNGTTALDVADGNVSITDDLAVDGTSNLDNTDIDGTLAVDGATISLDATTSFNIDNSNTTNGITIGTATSAVPISIGHTTSETTVNDNLVVTGDIDLAGSIDVDGTTNLDAVDIDGAVQIDNTITVGADDQGYDVIFYGDTASSNMTWDTSEDDLVLNDSRLFINQDDNVAAITIDTEATSAQAIFIDQPAIATENIIDVATPATTTHNVISLHGLDSLTSGRALYIESNADRDSGYPLVELHDDNGSNDGYSLKIRNDGGGDYLKCYNESTVAFRIGINGSAMINETANASMTTGLTINQGAADNEILAFKSSDVAHGITDSTETDTYAYIAKYSATEGGAAFDGFGEGDTGVACRASVTSPDTTKSTSGGGGVVLSCAKKSSATVGASGSDANLCVIRDLATTRFIFDAEGSFHADVESTTFDAYDDAQLVRAYDISHGKGMIESKFDQFIDYNHETLADLKLVGREEDGTPNRMVNVTGMQHLHNGAIWQQYTEMQKMKELMYDTMVEVIGKEKADQKLTDHDIQLLDNKTLLN